MLRNGNFMQDEKVVARIHMGDSEAEDYLSAKFTKRILFIARRKLPSIEDAEDIRQETLLAVLNAARQGKINNPERLSSFIYQICSNKIYDFFKSSPKYTSIDDQKDLEICTPAPINNWPSLEESDMLRAKWKKLKLLDRRILYLKYIRKMKYEDIAQNLNLSIQTLKKRAQRAKEKMRV